MIGNILAVLVMSRTSWVRQPVAGDVSLDAGTSSSTTRGVLCEPKDAETTAFRGIMVCLKHRAASERD